MSVETDSLCIKDYKHVFQPNLLRGQVAFVTGGGSGIGFTIAEVLMRHGCQVVIASRKLERVQSAARLLEAGTGGSCLALCMDVRNSKQVEAVVETILQQFGKLDILINNAAGNFLCPATSLSTNAFRTVMEIDAVGTFTASRAVYNKYMKDHGGSILNISATLHWRGQALQTHAGAAKAAVDAMTRHLAVEWGPNGVRVNSLAPGPITDTEGYRRLGGKVMNQMGESVWRHIPLQRAGTREDVANTALFLVSKTSSLITGTNMVIDGGHWLGAENSMHQNMAIMNAASKL